MYKEFSQLKELFDWVRFDKNTIGPNADLANRYPIRFILFDNFRDSFEFVSYMQTQFGCIVESVSNWMDDDYNDTIITHSKIATKITEHIRMFPMHDSVIAPFSELARFYDNKSNFEFDALVSTIKAIEATSEAWKNQQRIYIPIIGLEGKMSIFNNNSQIFIWYYKNIDKQFNYNLVLTNGTTYNIKGLEERFTVICNMQEWLNIWRDKNVKKEILSTSSSLYANALFAQPDNAFSFSVCHNIYDFLIKGLGLDLKTIEYKEKDENYWLRLAKEIDIANFSFDKFFNKYFHIDDLADFNVFLKTWFDCKDDFEKWLLTNYYVEKFCQKGYLCKAIKESCSYANYDFFAAIALTIFDLEDSEEYLDERYICLQQAYQRQIKLTNEIQEVLITKLQNLSIQNGCVTAIRYFSPLTNAEKSLAICWLGEGKITKEDIKSFFPELYNYLGKSFGANVPSQNWVFDYIDEYKQCKISNRYSECLEGIINKQNKSSLTFNHWYQDFKTTKTILSNRSDIEVYYWIDGLGIDWIPYISEQLNKVENIYLNEVNIARAFCPTTTFTNKSALLDLSLNNLQKIGDLDSHTHKQGNKYPNYIVEEISIINSAIEKILNEYAGKKIAIVSDHGLTALSQMREGLNLAGVESDHYGRFAVRTTGKAVSDNNYILLDDNKTMCALRHESLCAKIPVGQGAHGGCTPEEILVPIFIISSQQNANNWVAKLLTKEITGTNPVVKYSIKGLTYKNLPYVIYNNKRYELLLQENNTYYSDRITLIEGVNNIKLCIDSFTLSSQIKINLGAEEDDLFDL